MILAPLCVLDTMVVVSGIMGLVGGSDARTLLALETGLARLALSDAGLRELNAVLARDFFALHHPEPKRIFRAGLMLGLMGELYRPERFDWISLSDKKDWWILDLAFASGADFIVTRDKKVLKAANALGFFAVQPPEFLEQLIQ